jgi:hypothetical protein
MIRDECHTSLLGTAGGPPCHNNNLLTTDILPHQATLPAHVTTTLGTFTVILESSKERRLSIHSSADRKANRNETFMAFSVKNRSTSRVRTTKILETTLPISHAILPITQASKI